MLSVKQGSIKYHFFESLVWLDLGLNHGEHSDLANGLENIYIYIYIHIYIRVSWKVHWLTKMLSWNVTKQCSSFSIVTFVVHTHFFHVAVLQCLESIGQKCHLQQKWPHHMNFSVYELFSPPSFIYEHMTEYDCNIGSRVCLFKAGLASHLRSQNLKHSLYKSLLVVICWKYVNSVTKYMRL